MKVFLTGGAGFVGSNVAASSRRHGAEVLAPSHADVDIIDARAVARRGRRAPDAIVHCAILNDLGGLLRAPARGVGRLRRRDAQRRRRRQRGRRPGRARLDRLGLRRHAGRRATEDEPPNPINAYGFLKAAASSSSRARAPRRGRADRRRAGRAPRAAGAPAHPGRGLRLPRRLDRRGAARRPAVHGVGGPGA